MRDFRNLQVWQKGHRLTLEAYTATTGFPREELYELTSQIRRSAVSNLSYLDLSKYEDLIVKTREVKRMLAPFINKLKS